MFMHLNLEHFPWVKQILNDHFHSVKSAQKKELIITNTVLLLWYLSTKCNADYLQGESRQAVVVSVVSNGSFTYFTTCIEGGAGRVNDSVALHDGNVGLDNLQLRNTTTTNDRQTTVVETVSDQDK